MTEAVERRLDDRVSANLSATSRSAGPETSPSLEGRALDIGQGGLRLRITRSPKLKEGEPIVISIDTAGPKGLINVQGQVRWLKPSPDSNSEWDVGVHLSGPDLARWVLWLEQVL